MTEVPEPDATPEPKLDHVHVTYAWRSWNQSESPPVLLPAQAWDDLADEQLAKHRQKTTCSGFTLAESKDDAISVNVWVDVPDGWQEGVRAGGVDDVLKTTTAALAELVSTRHPTASDDIDTVFDDWRKWVAEKPDPLPHADLLAWPDAIGPDDARFSRFWGRKGVSAASRAPVKRGTCPGASLRLVVGPDRYAVHVEGYDHERSTGKVSFPSAPMPVHLWHLRTALARAVTRYVARVDDYEQGVRKTLADQEATGVETLLVESGKLLDAHAALETCRTAYVDAVASVEALPDAVEVDPSDHDAFEDLGRRIAAQRSRLVEAPQFLVAASSFRLAARSNDLAEEAKATGDRTESLTKWAATLVVPTLIAGAFGANVLPDSRVSWFAFLGLCVLMVGSGLATYLGIARTTAESEARRAHRRAGGTGAAPGSASRNEKAFGRHWWRVWLALALILVGGAGLSFGTASDEPTEVRVVERVVERGGEPVPWFGSER